MSDEHKLHRDVNRQAQAKALLDNEMLKGTLAHLEAAYKEAVFETAPADDAARFRFYLGVHVVRKFRDHLTKHLSDGKLAQREIDDLADKRKRFAGFGI